MKLMLATKADPVSDKSPYYVHLYCEGPPSNLMIYRTCYCFVCLSCCFTSQINSYGHGGTVSLPNHTFPGLA